jgi:RNA recognition motif-containing protein
MVKKLYIGNLPFSTTESDVHELFGQYGKVHSVKLIVHHETGKLRGFGFVEMDESEANTAMKALGGKQFGGRILRVNEAKDRRTRRTKRSQYNSTPSNDGKSLWISELRYKGQRQQRGAWYDQTYGGRTIGVMK